MTQPTNSKAVQHDTPDVSSLSVNVSDKEKASPPAALPAAESGDRTGRRGADGTSVPREPECMEAGAMDATPKPGARPLNVSTLKHGLRADPEKQAARLVLGKLTDKDHQALAGVEDDAYAYRKIIEAACSEANGEITLVQAHAIDTATRWFRHGQAAGLWLRSQQDDLDPAQKLAFSKAIAEAAERRDKALDRLNLERSAEAELDAFYRDLRSGALDADHKPGNAPGAKSEPLGGK